MQNSGADFVKTTQSAPKNAVASPGRRHAAFDGDADRIVYFYFDASSSFHLLDGDKISSLVAKYLKDLLKTGFYAVPLESMSISREGMLSEAEFAYFVPLCHLYIVISFRKSSNKKPSPAPLYFSASFSLLSLLLFFHFSSPLFESLSRFGLCQHRGCSNCLRQR